MDTFLLEIFNLSPPPPIKNVMSDRANIVTAEIGTPDNLTDQV